MTRVPIKQAINLADFASTSCEVTAIKTGLYILVAVVSHIGTHARGHYVAYVRDDKSGSWLEYNDSREVRPMTDRAWSTVMDGSGDQAVYGCPYILVYKQLPWKQQLEWAELRLARGDGQRCRAMNYKNMGTSETAMDAWYDASATVFRDCLVGQVDLSTDIMGAWLRLQVEKTKKHTTRPRFFVHSSWLFNKLVGDQEDTYRYVSSWSPTNLLIHTWRVSGRESIPQIQAGEKLDAEVRWRGGICVQYSLFPDSSERAAPLGLGGVGYREEDARAVGLEFCPRPGIHISFSDHTQVA